ncbi:hypothetical protein B566_EDAN012533 [Ephemera danica]|nr:hypothetical protein B566_EDAN012533 [Ephemera danica]
MFKFVVLSALVAVASAGVIAPLGYAAAPVLARTAVVNADYDPNPQYAYSYSVADALTGDNKQQKESRNGDVVQGSYSLVEADGTRRVVQYTADPINGFNAVVSKEGAAVVAKVATPVVAARVAAPLAYAAPVARYASPVVSTYSHAPAFSTYAAPAVAHYAAPALTHYAAAPAVVKTHFASPYATYVH